jgi:glycosidase
LRFASVALIASLCLVMSGTAIPTHASDQDAVPPVRSPIAAERFYFVMTDRYRDGDPANNRGGRTGPMSVTGYDPTSDAYFHGGDLAGLTGSCDLDDPSDHGLARIRRLGFTALWITPPFVQRTVQGDSAAYHGYWFLDLSRPDPHLGEAADMRGLMDCARKLGMKVFLDVVVNHTADVITYEQGNAYVPVSERPYRTASGKVFNPFRFARGTSFPKLSRNRSFAKTPVVPEEFRDAKVPAFLNNVLMYHNRGDIDWGSCSGVCLMDGDFVGLDDLMTEDWRVVSGLADAYGAWIRDFGVDGFRLDTAKHVDPYFFGRWLPLIDNVAQDVGKSGFTTFAEVWESDPVVLSETMIRRQLPSVLDFPFQEAMREYATGRGSGRSLALLFNDDDLYTTQTTNAYGLTTFLGNHDMGRIGFFLDRQSVDRELLDRARLAHSVLYLTRGVPVVYYGDEVGMTGSGDGRDKRARQDMFPTQVPIWRTESRIGGAPIGERSSFGQSNPLEAHLTALAALRDRYPALATGAQITRGESGGGIVLSRFDLVERREFLVAFNNAATGIPLTVPTSTPNTTWTPILGDPAPLTSGADGSVRVTMPARAAVVWRADLPLPPAPAPQIRVTARPDRATGRLLASARVPGADPARVAFEVRSGGNQAWLSVGTDDAPPYRVYLDRSALGLRGPLALRAVVQTSSGSVATSAPVRVAAERRR